MAVLMDVSYALGIGQSGESAGSPTSERLASRIDLPASTLAIVSKPV